MGPFQRAFFIAKVSFIMAGTLCAFWLSWKTDLFTSLTMSGISDRLAPLLEVADASYRKFILDDSYAIDYTTEDSRTHKFCPQRTDRQAGTTIENLASAGPPEVINWSQISDMTSPELSDFTIVNLKSSFALCDQIELFIQARNGRKENKTYGGDYFRAKIFTKTKSLTASSSSDGEVVDHQNGTYSVFLTLKWAGPVGIRVTLVHPSEAVYVIRKFRDSAPARYVYRGKFVSKDKKLQEETFCNIAMPGNTSNLCNFTDIKTGSPWFCVKPKSNHLTCDHWTQHRCDTAAAYVKDMSSLNALEKSTLIPPKDIHGKIQSVTVEDIASMGDGDLVESNPRIHYDAHDLPYCKRGIHIGRLNHSGYYHNNEYYAPHCKINHYDVNEMTTCLTNKKVYFLGDSTIRQLFEFYLKTMTKTLKKTSSGYEPRWHVGPTRAADVAHNISMMFRFHAYPIGRNSWAEVADIHYIANELDSIAADNQTVVLISVWAHFTHEPKWFYEQRMRKIMDAVARLQARSPSTLVVVKSGNTRDHANMYKRLFLSDWMARNLDQIMRKTVFGNPNVAFMDAWDMSSAQLLADDVHPAGPHVENLSNQLLTFMCPFLNDKDSSSSSILS